MSVDCFLGLPPEEALALAASSGLHFEIVRTGARSETRKAEEAGALFEDRVIAVRDQQLVVGRFRVRLQHEMSRRS